jgi:hypothetical protein
MRRLNDAWVVHGLKPCAMQESTFAVFDFEKKMMTARDERTDDETSVEAARIIIRFHRNCLRCSSRWLSHNLVRLLQQCNLCGGTELWKFSERTSKVSSPAFARWKASRFKCPLYIAVCGDGQSQQIMYVQHGLTVLDRWYAGLCTHQTCFE